MATRKKTASRASKAPEKAAAEKAAAEKAASRQGDVIVFAVLEPLRHNGERYEPGETVEMTARDARDLLIMGVIKPVPVEG